MWLWRIADWTPAGQPLEAHSLTVTQMAFSSTGQHLLTVSRDRTFAVWERQTAGEISNPPCLDLCIAALQRRCLTSAGTSTVQVLCQDSASVTSKRTR